MCLCWYATRNYSPNMTHPQMNSHYWYNYCCMCWYMTVLTHCMNRCRLQCCMNAYMPRCRCWSGGSQQMYMVYYMFGFLSSSLMKQHRNMNCCNIVSPMSMMSYTYRNIHWGSRFAYRPGYMFYSTHRLRCTYNCYTGHRRRYTQMDSLHHINYKMHILCLSCMSRHSTECP